MRAVPLVLMFHAIEDTADDPYSICIPPRRFAAQMAALADRGWRGVGMTELLEASRAGTADRLVGLTFDDGYASVARHALPVLQRHGFGATSYPVAGMLGGVNAWDPEGPRRGLMTASAVRELAAAGIEIGSHGMAHLSCCALSDPDLAADLRDSKAQLEDVTGRPVRSFCYPFGHLDRRVTEQVREAGYDSAVGIGCYDAVDDLQLPRIYMGSRDGMSRLRVKRVRQAWRLRAARAGGRS